MYRLTPEQQRIVQSIAAELGLNAAWKWQIVAKMGLVHQPNQGLVRGLVRLLCLIRTGFQRFVEPEKGMKWH